MQAVTKPNKLRKKLDNLDANREDRRRLTHRFTLLKAISDRHNHRATPLVAALALMLLSCACSSSQSPAPGLFSPPPSLSGTATPAAARSLSSMEAISRGVAAVTPPGAVLKDVYYHFDSVELESDAIEILKKNAEWLNANPKVRVEVEGHCDDVGSAEYNLALGAKRAQTAKDYLVSQGVAAERMVTISYGKEAPACFELTEECRVQNRRARFVIFTEVPTS
jgi:peptidoglycan-associated lipoprotein